MVKKLTVVALLALTALAHRSLTGLQEEARAHSDISLKEVPDGIAGFRKMEEVVVDEHVLDLLDTPHVLMRNYASPAGVPVQLTIVYTGQNRSSLHFPEVCLTGQGWEVREQYSAPVGVLFVGRRLVLFKGEAEEAVLYWFKAGDFLTGSYFLNSVYWAREQLLFHGVGSMMVKVSTPVSRRGTEHAFQTLNTFATGLAPILAEEFN